MEKAKIEKILEQLGSEQVPSDVQGIAEEVSQAIDTRLKRKREVQFKEYIMKRYAIKIAVAAVIVFVVLVGIPFFSTSGPSVTLAGVYEKIQLVDAFMYRMKATTTGQPGVPGGIVKMDATILISNEYGVKMDTETDIIGMGQKMIQQMYVLPQEKSIYMVMPEQKQYVQMEFSDDLLAQAKKQGNDPRGIIKQIMNCKYSELDRRVIDGIEVEGFETTDPAYGGGALEDLKVVLWVDVKSWLPVRLETNMKMTEQMEMEAVLEDFQWDLLVDAREFEPVIPDDYTTLPGGAIKIPEMSEEGAIEGLQVFVEMVGEYPKNLNIYNLTQEFVALKDSDNLTEAAMRFKEEMEQLSEEEQGQKIIDKTMPIQSLGIFYMTLIQEKKEPAYYGDVVTPADTDMVLLRWKTGENEYRVIYGDLSAETVDGQVLAELESQIEQ